MRTVGVLGSITMLFGAVLVTAPNSMAGTSLTLTTSPARVQLSALAGASQAAGKIRVTVDSTAIPARVAAVYSDVVSDDSGNWQKAPAGSTSYSLDGYLTVSPTETSVAADPKAQSFDVNLSVPVSTMEQPRVGIVSITLIPGSGAASTGQTVTQGIAIDTIVVAEADPSGITNASNVRVSLLGTGVTIDPTNQFTIVDSTIPDFIPGLVDHGPIDASAHYRNSGDFIVDAQTRFDFATVGPAAMFGGDDAGDVFYTLNDANHYALPGQPAVAKGTSMVETNGAAVDTLPFIGFVKVTATTTGTLGPLTAAPVVQSTVFLVFPWKEALVLILLIVLWVLFKRWRRNRRDRRNELPPVSEVREPVESVT